jgi:opacity protein-like surface antigen
MFKKLRVLITIASLLFSKVAMADSKYYIKGGMGINHIHTVKFSNHDFEGKIRLANSFPLIEGGVGCKLTDSIRAEILFDYYFLFHTAETSYNPNKDIFKILVTTKADSLMLNIYKDVLKFGKITPFIGGGVGIATLKEVGKGFAISVEDKMHFPLESTQKKTFYKFAYKLTAGLDMKISETATAEVSYNYFNLGNNKSRNIGGLKNIGNRNYGVHNITAGLRFAI